MTHPMTPVAPSRPFLERFKLARDYRSDLPPVLRRFTGYKEPGPNAPFPWPPLSYLQYLPQKYEDIILGWIACFVALLLIESVMIKSSLFQGWGVPLVVASFGASAVLLYGAPAGPLSQPRHAVGGHVLSALVSVIITRLCRLSSSYQVTTYAQGDAFGHLAWLNALLSMATSLSVMQLTDTLHPPGGATALIAATQPGVVALSWKYLLVIFVSSVLMVGWACIIKNLGRRRYPAFFWSSGRTFVRQSVEEKQEKGQA